MHHRVEIVIQHLKRGAIALLCGAHDVRNRLAPAGNAKGGGYHGPLRRKDVR